MAMLASKFESRARKTAPLAVEPAAARHVRWLKPDLVAEIAFAEYTASGSVRHASFVGLRADKEARNVTPAIREAATAPTTDVVISNRSRVIFPETKATKGALTDYYAAVAPILLPYMVRRPVSHVPCPHGLAKHCFFQQHDSCSSGEHVP